MIDKLEKLLKRFHLSQLANAVPILSAEDIDLIEDALNLSITMQRTPFKDPIKALDVIEAAKWAVFCPEYGGYKEGISMETCFENLDDAVKQYFDTKIDTPVFTHWTQNELHEKLNLPPFEE